MFKLCPISSSFHFQYKAELIQSFSDTAVPLFESRQLVPVIDKQFPLAEVAEAHRYVEKNLNVGKVILKVVDDHN